MVSAFWLFGICASFETSQIYTPPGITQAHDQLAEGESLATQPGPIPGAETVIPCYKGRRFCANRKAKFANTVAKNNAIANRTGQKASAVRSYSHPAIAGAGAWIRK